MTEPVASYGDLSWWGNFAEYGFLTRLRAEQLRDVGATMTPFNAFLFLLGPGDAAAAHGRPRGQRRGRWPAFLDEHPAVAWVAYAGLPVVAVARAGPALPAARAGRGVLLRRGRRARRRRSASSSACELASHLANVGDAKTLVIHPARTTHAQLDDDALVGAGVSPELIRISVGIEDADDICRDLDQALARRRSA